MRKVKQDKEALKSDEMAELLGVAKIAGLDVKSPSDRLNKFDDELMEDDDDLDLSVGGSDEVADPFERRSSGESITRMDEDTGSSGVW